MAITITGSPETYPSMHGDLWHIVTSNNSSNSGFKFVFDLTISGVTTRIKLFPDGNGYGSFNASAIVRNYWSTYFKPNTTQTAFSYTGNDLFVSYTIQFGEEFNNTLTTNLASGSYTAYNFYNPPFRNPSTSYFSGYADKWLSNRDLTQLECVYGEKLFMSYFKSSTGTLSLTIQKYNEGGSVNGTASTGGLVTCNAVTLFDISPTAINTYLGSSFITTSTYAYGVKVAGLNEAIVTLDCNAKFTPYTLHFLNQLGGYDSFNFRMINKQNITGERKTYNSMPYSISSGNMVKYDASRKINPTNVAYAVKQGVKYKLTSDFINVTDYNWLKELVFSPEVYLESGGYYYPVTINTSNWEEKIRFDKMFNLVLEIELPDVYSQYR